MVNSLSRSLLMWLLIPLLAVALFNVWTTYKTVSEVADLRSDQSLLGSARNIAESIRVSDGISNHRSPHQLSNLLPRTRLTLWPIASQQVKANWWLAIPL